MNQITVAFCNDSITIELKQFGKIVLILIAKNSNVIILDLII